MLLVLSATAVGVEPEDTKQVDKMLLDLKFSADLTGRSVQSVPPSVMQSNESEVSAPKSRGKAFLFSFLLPGAGEYYLGRKGLAKTFFFTEVALWATYISFNKYSDWKRDDMYALAASHADADIDDKPSQYFVDLGNYMDVYEYNEAKQRMGEFFNVYDVDSYYWSWDTAANRKEFEDLRIASDRAHDRANFAIGAILANHVISAIDAVWQSNRYNKKLRTSGMSIHLDSRPGQMLGVSLTTRF